MILEDEITKRGRDAVEKADAFLKNARRALDEGDLDPCIHDLFPPCEFAANVLREKIGEEPSEDHEVKLESAQRAYRKSLIGHKEYHAYERVYQLKSVVQYYPYYKVKKTKKSLERVTPQEAVELFAGVVSLVEKAKQYANE